MRALMMTAVSAEKEAVSRGIQGTINTFDVCIAGVGPILAAVNTMKALAAAEYDIVISAGIGGGFADRTEVGSVVVADSIIAADLGAETAEGFSSLDELGLGATRVHVDTDLATRITKALQAAGLQTVIGPVLTVSTVTGTSLTTKELQARVPGAAAEGMEGYGVAVAAHDYGVPIIEIRSISNLVGPRDRSSWRIKEALHILEKASTVLAEVL